MSGNKKSVGLSGKIALVMGLFTLGMAFLAWHGVDELRQSQATMEYLTQRVAQRALIATEIDSLTNNVLRFEKMAILEKEVERKKEMLSRMEGEAAAIHKDIAKYRIIMTDADKENLEVIDKTLYEWEKMSESFKEMVLSGDFEAAYQHSSGDSRKLMYKIGDNLSELVKRAQTSFDKEVTASREQLLDAIKMSVFLSLVIVALCLSLGFYFVRKTMVAIDKVILSLQNNSHQLSSAATQIASNSSELAQASHEQAASLEQTASAMEEIKSMVERNTEAAGESSEASHEGRALAQKGKERIHAMQQSMRDILKANENIVEGAARNSEKFSEIVRVINEIDSKTGIINDIVFQTKLLSFNASVEAARAGEAGKGFAVVAAEVGTLAQRSGTAAKEIEELLEESKNKVQLIVKESQQEIAGIVNDAKRKVEEGTQIAKECDVALDEIVESTEIVGAKVEAIAKASAEQSRGVQEVNLALTQLDQVTQVNSQSSEECASAAEQLSGQATELHSIVATLIEVVKGDKIVVAVETKRVQKNIDGKVIKLDRKKKVATITKEADPTESDSRFVEL